MKPRYTLRQLAENDLEQIWLYTLQAWGVNQADHYIHSIVARFNWLLENPYLGSQRFNVKIGYYAFPEGYHVIFYTITHYGIDIIGIPHQRMDVVNH